MARAKRGTRMPKIEPATRTLFYQVGDGTSYIDLAKDLSKVNRRLYRSGMTYVVEKIQLFLPPGMRQSDVAQFTFSTAGSSWIVHNAWMKGYAAWRKQQREMKEFFPTAEGKWADFKVYLDDSMEDGTILEPYAADGAVYSAGEWIHSKLVFDDDGTEREFKMHLIGSSNLADTNEESGIGLIQEYQNSRRYPNADPALPTAANETIYAKLIGMSTDELTDMMVNNMEDDNDLPPYDQDEYPGGDTNADAAVPQCVAAISGTEAEKTVPGFVAECGLIKIGLNEIQLVESGDPSATLTSKSVYAVTTAATCGVLVTLAPGPYRGVLAAPMGQ